VCEVRPAYGPLTKKGKQNDEYQYSIKENDEGNGD
jgi:hypothetical protein